MSHLRVKDTQHPHGREWRAYYWADSAKVDYTTALIPEGHHSPEAAKAWALQWVREGAQTLEQSSESDETEVVQEPVPAPRGRVVARWERATGTLGRVYWRLVAARFSTHLYEDDRGLWRADVYLDERKREGLLSLNKQQTANAAVEYIRAFVAPFGGELVVEGEP